MAVCLAGQSCYPTLKCGSQTSSIANSLTFHPMLETGRIYASWILLSQLTVGVSLCHAVSFIVKDSSTEDCFVAPLEGTVRQVLRQHTPNISKPSTCARFNPVKGSMFDPDLLWLWSSSGIFSWYKNQLGWHHQIGHQLMLWRLQSSALLQGTAEIFTTWCTGAKASSIRQRHLPRKKRWTTSQRSTTPDNDQNGKFHLWNQTVFLDIWLTTVREIGQGDRLKRSFCMSFLP